MKNLYPHLNLNLNLNLNQQELGERRLLLIGTYSQHMRGMSKIIHSVISTNTKRGCVSGARDLPPFLFPIRLIHQTEEPGS